MMKKLLVPALLLVSASVFAAEQGGQAAGRPKRQRDQYARRYKTSYYGLAYALPGAYGLINRLELSDEQKKVLGEVYSEYTTRQRKAYAGIRAKLPRLSREDWRDPEKRAAYTKEYRELMKTQKATISVEAVANVLTPDQLGKILSANELCANWQKWVVEYLIGTGNELDGVLGPEPAEVDAAKRALLARLAYYIKGGALLYRLGLTKEQHAELEKLAGEARAQRSAVGAMTRLSLAGDKLTPGQASAARSAIFAKAYQQIRERHAARAEGLLTQVQKDKLAKAAAIIDSRDKEIATRFIDYITKVDKILPAPRRKAGVRPGGYYPYPQTTIRRPRKE